MKKGLLCALIVFLADQLSKTWVLSYFANHSSPVRVTPFFNFVLAWNKGVSFSMFHSNHPAMPWVFVTVSLLICAVILYWMSVEKNKATICCFGLIVGGALGNVLDRIRFKAVVDFLDFHIDTYHWPAFNVGDSAICIGAGAILIWNLFFAPTEKLSEPQKENKQ
ncbi:MAG: signal peptidase II [Alphaproteobacteria bacterium]|nr:signal peptidase II [Alphaproteobacteria bacterium]MBO4644250.1 signal peptidase II [Alphaproteobacteria bacterium]